MVYVFREIAILLLILPLFNSCFGDSAESDKSSKRKIEASLCSGDLAFRRGSGVVSEAVILANRCGNYSHTGVVVERDGEWFVVHEVPYESRSRVSDKIYCQPISEFFATDKAQAGAIFRVGIDSLAVAEIERYLDRQLLREVPFDHDYDLSDTTKLYCTELVWRAYNVVGVDLSEGRRTNLNIPSLDGEKILPIDIEVNENLELIYRF